MPLHPLAEEFAAVAELYERGRPGYPPPVVETLMAELGLEPGAAVLDLAAGTGKLTRALVAAGLDVQAVEPLAALRTILAAAVGGERVRDGLAEAIPFADEAFAALTVSDAFHWFDPAPALAEMRRVLAPGGALALISTVPELPEAVGRLVADARTPHPYFDGPPWQDTLAAAPGWSGPRRVSVVTRQRVPLRDYVGSMSWVAARAPREREGLVSQIPDDAPEIAVHAVMWLSARD